MTDITPDAVAEIAADMRIAAIVASGKRYAAMMGMTFTPNPRKLAEFRAHLIEGQKP